MDNRVINRTFSNITCQFRLWRDKTRTICTALHVTGLILMLAFALQIINGVLTQGEISALNNWVYIDSLSAIFLGLIAIVGTLAGIYSIGYIGTEYREGHLDLKTYCNYYGFLHLFFFTMIISVITNNVILMWAAIEATTLSSAFLVGTYKTKKLLLKPHGNTSLFVQWG